MSKVDIAFLAALVGLVYARWLEFRGGDPRTATGEPAAMMHFRQYAWSVMGIGVGLWIITNVIGNHLRVE